MSIYLTIHVAIPLRHTLKSLISKYAGSDVARHFRELDLTVRFIEYIWMSEIAMVRTRNKSFQNKRYWTAFTLKCQ
jgi:hypothetical protein